MRRTSPVFISRLRRIYITLFVQVYTTVDLLF